MVLNIETSHNLTSISLSSKKKIESILNINPQRPNHCEVLVPLIVDIMEKNSIQISEIDEIRVNVGPGNLSSLRVGISIANIFGSFKNIPTFGVSSFLLYAFSYDSGVKDLVTIFNLRNDYYAYAKFCNSSNKVSLLDYDFKIHSKDILDINVKDSYVVGTGASKIQSLSYKSKDAPYIVDTEFFVDSSALSKVDMNFDAKFIFKNHPLEPFNSFSFVS
ncbi:MAG: tRNA (adenosine(37)-N6)-threonylcarbamoyltransferase complex dimerization subunit type 1 TsaB [Thermodesulfobacteriota bacteirum]|nr:tRNA (adenosine(37)-N6)-threonylcarbamoyltransferase complex dimerization subunit type 1 TsaB [Thermodesulfobacteriota bacterium]